MSGPSTLPKSDVKIDEETRRWLAASRLAKYNENHDELGRFSTLVNAREVLQSWTGGVLYTNDGKVLDPSIPAYSANLIREEQRLMLSGLPTKVPEMPLVREVAASLTKMIETNGIKFDKLFRGISFYPNSSAIDEIRWKTIKELEKGEFLPRGIASFTKDQGVGERFAGVGGSLGAGRVGALIIVEDAKGLDVDTWYKDHNIKPPFDEYEVLVDGDLKIDRIVDTTTFFRIIYASYRDPLPPIVKYNENHDEIGRFTSSSFGGFSTTLEIHPLPEGPKPTPGLPDMRKQELKMGLRQYATSGESYAMRGYVEKYISGTPFKESKDDYDGLRKLGALRIAQALRDGGDGIYPDLWRGIKTDHEWKIGETHDVPVGSFTASGWKKASEFGRVILHVQNVNGLSNPYSDYPLEKEVLVSGKFEVVDIQDWFDGSTLVELHYVEPILKYNENHDDLGRFTFSGEGSSGSGGGTHSTSQLLTGTELMESVLKDATIDRARFVRETVRNLKDTTTLYKIDGEWTQERLDMHADILREFLDKARDVPKDRQAIILGGLPGAGKSSFLRGDDALKYGIDEKQYFTVNPDAIKDALLARNGAGYAEQYGLKQGERSGLLHEESSMLASTLMDQLKQDGTNVIYDYTLSSERSGEGKIDAFHDSNYDVKLVFVDTTLETSLVRAEHRYEGDGSYNGRYVDFLNLASTEITDGHSPNYWAFQALKDMVEEWVLVDNNVKPTVVDSSK